MIFFFANKHENVGEVDKLLKKLKLLMLTQKLELSTNQFRTEFQLSLNVSMDSI